VHPDAAALVEELGLEPLPVEGGWFRQTWRSPDTLPGGRPLGTAIVALFADTPDGFSAMHRLPTAEVWHFYLGDPLELLLLDQDGSSSVVTLGRALRSGHAVQAIVRAGVWMGGRVVGSWSLVGSTMAPGFTEGDFEAGERSALVAAYPQRAAEIVALTR
jgi:predicted cupin superfamily sugar epimerase